MDITVYLPDALGKRAKDDGVNLSGMLRVALEQHFIEADAMSTALADVQDYEFDLIDRDGEPYTGRFTGALIADDDRREVYLTEDERVLVRDLAEDTVTATGEDVEAELRDILDPEAYKRAMNRLGIRPIVDL